MSAPARLLVVEDEYLVAAFLDRALRLHGYTVTGPCHTVAEAMQAIAEPAARIDGAVLDVALRGGETSLPVAQELHQRGIPFLFLTGDDRIVRSGQAGAAAVLIKPVSLPRLIEAVGAMLSAP